MSKPDFSLLSKLFRCGDLGRPGRLRSLRRLVVTAAVFGTCDHLHADEKTIGNSVDEVNHVMHEIDRNTQAVHTDVRSTRRPITRKQLESGDIYLNRQLDDVTSAALAASPVLRTIGGIVLRSPDAAITTLNRQLQQTDPRFGTAAALSAFDAQLSATANFNKNDRIFNNNFYAGGATAFMQDYHDYQAELSKRTATGSSLAIRGVSNYDSNNAPANTFPSSWNSWMEGEVRQPLLQGGGLEFNRIAGPSSTPGLYNGILIAKVNGDMTDAEFQVGLRDFVSNLENAYWDLYAAYREYDARNRGYQAIEKLYRERYQQFENLPAGDAQARETEAAFVKQQVLSMKAELDESLFGRLINGTEVRNGSTGGTLQTVGGVLSVERRLRLLAGMPASDGKLIRPIDEPSIAEYEFDWELVIDEALLHRPELQKQNLAVRKRELELLAAKNYLYPRLDAVSRYRVRGFGDDLVAGGNQSGTNPASSVGNLFGGDHQEWAMGVEFTVPLGFRKAHASVANAELNLHRERILQREQQREVVSGLAAAFTDKERAWENLQTTLGQYLSARKYTDAVLNREDTADERKIDAIRKLTQAEAGFFRARAEYAIALKNIHFEKGSILELKNLRLHGQDTISAADVAAPVPPVPSTDQNANANPRPDVETPRQTAAHSTSELKLASHLKSAADDAEATATDNTDPQPKVVPRSFFPRSPLRKQRPDETPPGRASLSDPSINSNSESLPSNPLDRRALQSAESSGRARL
ncbi:MAG: TolC family protein [Planctomyces sp.]|jgi:hypothetical protein